MSTTAIAPELLVVNTRSADKSVADATVATTPGDGWVISMGAYGSVGRLILFFSADGSGDTVTILKGDRPPSMLKEKGDLTIVLAASDERMIMIEPGRFLQNDNTILATCVDAGTGIRAWFLPKGWGGGSAVA